MKKIKKDCSATIPYAPLYLDDLEEIVNLIKEKLPNIIFDDDEYEYNTLEELIEKRGTWINKITMCAREPEKYGRLTLTINGRSIRLYADSDYELQWHKIQSFVSSRVSWQEKLTFPFFSGMALFVLVFQYSDFIDSKKNTFTPPIWFHILVAIAAIFFAFSLWQIRFNKGVTLEKRHTIKGFFSRNLDRILMLVLGGIVTWLIKLIIGWFGSK